MNRAPVASALTLSALTLVLAGCGGGSSPTSTSQPSTPRVSPASLEMVTNACDPSALPSGYALDKAHSGEVTSHSYSAAVDLQAALQYDELQSGAREIYLHRVASTKSKVDGVVSCVSLRFPSVDQAARFFGSFQTLRKQASAVVTKLHPAPHVKGLTGTTAYLEREQSFRGYGIASTDVLEIAGLEGSTLHIVSVGGAQPSKAVAVRIVRSGVSA